MRCLSLFPIALLVVGCGSAATPAGGAGGTIGTGGAGTGGGAGSGSGGTSGSGGAGSGSGGSVGGSGGTSGSGGTDGGPPDSAAGDTGSGAGCPAGAVICEDFEKFAAGATDLSPDWQAYTYGGATVQVDSSKPFKGARALHLTAPVGGRKYADIIKQTAATKALLPNKHYGRAMLWLTATPSSVHWNINQAGGPLASDPNLLAKYSEGGQMGVLEPNYTQRAPVGDGLTPLRGGGPQDGDPNPPPVDCALAARTEKMPVKKWVCWEWMFDADTNQMQLWVDSVAQTEIDIANKAVGACVSGGARVWQGPKLFNKMIIGWEQYTSPSEVAQDAWVDDLVVSSQRVGCPAAP